MNGQAHQADSSRRIRRASMFGSFIATLILSPVTRSAEFEELSVSESEGEYRLSVVSVLNAPAHYVYNIITDYKHAYRINPSILEARVLPADPNAVLRVMNRSEHMVGPFRFIVDWVGDISETVLGTITVTTIPELSSFESGYAIWKIRPQGKRTRVIYEASLKPKFSIPPLIGDYMMKNKLESESVAIFGRIECHARHQLQLDMENDPELLLKDKQACNTSDGYATSVVLERKLTGMARQE